MLQYSPTHRLFPSYGKMRATTFQTKINHRRLKYDLECLENITYSMFDSSQNKPSARSGSVRLCGELTDFEQHVESQSQRKIQDYVGHVVLILILFVNYLMSHLTSSHKEDARQRRHAS